MYVSPPKTVSEVLEFLEPGAIAKQIKRLTEGQSGSSVWSLFVESPRDSGQRDSITGYRILKISRSPYKKKDGEGWRHLECKKHAKEFMEEYAPELHTKSAVDGDWTYLLFTVANPLKDAKTVALSSTDGRLPHVLRYVARQLLQGNSGHESSAFNQKVTRKTYTCFGLLKRWVGYRLDPVAIKANRIHEVRRLLSSGHMVFVDDRRCIDPLTACSSREFREILLEGVSMGYLHGDLHVGNILCPQNSKSASEFWIIDFEKSGFGPLLYDHAYLTLSLLSSLDASLEDSTLLSLLESTAVPESNSEVDLVKRSMSEIEMAVSDWQKANLGHGPTIGRQWRLAMLAAAINWANKRYPPDLKYRAERAYKVAAFAADRFCKAEGIKIDLTRLPLPRQGGYSDANKPIKIPSGRGSSETTPEAFLSGLLILNALLASGREWDAIKKELGANLFWKLRNGYRMTPTELRRLRDCPSIQGLFDDHTKIPAFMTTPDTLMDDRNDVTGYRRRLDLIGRTDAPSNSILRELIEDKMRFADAAWLGAVKATLKEVRDWTGPISERTWLLRGAYYHAGTRLTAEEMAAAALADFGHERWQRVINQAPSAGIPHLRAANEKIAQLVSENLLSGRRVISILEGGAGGGHTAYFLLKRLREIPKIQVRYLGLELVPALSEELNAMFISPDGDPADEREALFRELGKDDRLHRFPMAKGRAVLTGRMEETIPFLWDAMRIPTTDDGNPGGQSIDVFVTSFAFHHVPNGEAIIRFLSNDAQGFDETLDRSANRQAIADAIASGVRALQKVPRTDGDQNVYKQRREEILRAVPSTCPQAKVFLSLFEPTTITASEVESFCVVLTKHFSFPRRLLRLMLRNPQREVLLTVQSLLSDSGLLVIADPDGTSSFNARRAYSDHELTIANFLSSDELRAQLEEVGFAGIEEYRLLGEVGGPADVQKDLQSGHWRTQVEPDLGYILIARRDRCRERELAGINSRPLKDDQVPIGGQESELTHLGELLRKAEPDAARIVGNMFSPADPIPHSGQIFRNFPELRESLRRLDWVEMLPGATVIAKKRIHRFEFGRGIYIATDFPRTAAEVREGARRVFSYSDEAHALLPKLRGLLESRDRVPNGARVLDLCSGAGTLGILCAVMRPDITVVSWDREERAVLQAIANRTLNAIDPKRFIAQKVNLRDSFEASSIPAMPTFHLIVADPPFSLRPPWVVSSSDDGGRYGDEITRALVAGAHAHLVPNGTMLMLAYSLIRREPGEGEEPCRINDYIKGTGLSGQFRAVDSPTHRYVWRFRHDKVAENIPGGVKLPYLLIRLGDPTRPESIIFKDSAEQRREFQRYLGWLEELDEYYSGLQYMIGEFRRYR